MPTPLRAALLAAWGTAFLCEAEPLDRVVAMVEGTDEPHLVVSDPFQPPDDLAEGLTDLRRRGLVGLRLALPAPGDLLGLTGPPAMNRAALAAGEAVVGCAAPGAVPPGGSVPALVPDVKVFGTPGDQGHCVTWRETPASPAWPDVPTLGQADRELKEALREAAEAISRVRTVPGRRDRREAASRARSGSALIRLPDLAGARAQGVADQALQALSIVAAAQDDDQAALTSFGVQTRGSALAAVERAARRALVAATGACLAPVGR